MKNKIAEVAVPISIALDAQFDYLIPDNLSDDISVGCRVLVPFRRSLVTGYVTRVKRYSAFEKKLKPIKKNLNSGVILDNKSFDLALNIHFEHCCSLAEAIGTVLPSGLKNIKTNFCEDEILPKQELVHLGLSKDEAAIIKCKELGEQVVLVHDLSSERRWCVYSALIKETLNSGRSVIFLVPDYRKINPSIGRLNLSVTPFIMTSRISPKEALKVWLAIKRPEVCFVAGTRSAVFAPVKNLGLIIIEEEEHFAYRQDQVPHYSAKDIALYRAKGSQAKVVLGSFMPSLDSYFLAKKAAYLKFEAPSRHADVKIIDMQDEFRGGVRKKVVSRVLEYHIARVLDRSGKMLIFVNKLGFSTFLFCRNCKTIQACPGCSSSLRYHYKEKKVFCPSCSYKADSFELCPNCKSSYVKYSGYGSEKVESEILRLFPSARIFSFGKGGARHADYDIMIATQQFLEEPDCHKYSFDAVAVLSCEEMLGHMDFRSTEKAYSKLLRLLFLAREQLFLQTQIPEHYALKFLANRDVAGFIKYELSQRKDLNLPPFIKMGVLTIRSQDLNKSKIVAQRCFKLLKRRCGREKVYEVLGPIECVPFKVRKNYRFQILIKYNSLMHLSRIIRSITTDRHKGVIATFDPSP